MIGGHGSESHVQADCKIVVTPFRNAAVRTGLRPVKVGPKVGGDWVIDSGVQAGERVVIEGVQKVRNGMKVAVKPVAAAG